MAGKEHDDVFSGFVGAELVEVSFVHDYLQLGFSNFFGMSIFNDYEFSGKYMPSAIGSVIVRVVFQPGEKVLISFSNKDELCVDLRDSAYHSPEAVNLHLPDEPYLIVLQ